jgi:hypothetical protein
MLAASILGAAMIFQQAEHDCNTLDMPDITVRYKMKIVNHDPYFLDFIFAQLLELFDD